MKKIIITETQLKMLLKENESSEENVEYYDFKFEVEMVEFGWHHGTFSITLFDETENGEYDYEKSKTFEVDFDWETEDEEFIPTGTFKIRMVYPEKREVDEMFLDFLVSDERIGEAIKKETLDAYEKFNKNFNPY